MTEENKTDIQAVAEKYIETLREGDYETLMTIPSTLDSKEERIELLNKVIELADADEEIKEKSGTLIEQLKEEAAKAANTAKATEESEADDTKAEGTAEVKTSEAEQPAE